MKAQFADLPSGLAVPRELAQQRLISPALAAQAPDITVNAPSIRNIANGFLNSQRFGAEIDIPEGARQVRMVMSDTMANVIGGCLHSLANMMEANAEKSVEEAPTAKIEVINE